MADLHGEERAVYVRRMFGRIAGRYDLLNRLMTAGQDRRWLREVVRRARPLPGERVLDLGCGTGDLAWETLRQSPQSGVICADFTHAMLALARRRQVAGAAAWVLAGALHPPLSGGPRVARGSGV